MNGRQVKTLIMMVFAFVLIATIVVMMVSDSVQ